jgi:hypothetical protein
MPESDKTVDAQPSKAFFIDMITRDLGLTDCILDLIDNAVDHAVARTGADVMKLLTNGGAQRTLEGCSVDVTMSEGQFVIRDTCGGISIHAAKTSVFLFGNPVDRGSPGGLSVFGIGMKRAFFKMGRQILVDSHTETEWFTIDINVDEWQKKGDRNWDFEFKETGARFPNDGKGPAGTTIRVTRLHDDVRERFTHASFHNELMNRIAATYALFISAGLTIQLQGESIPSNLPTLGTSDDRLTPGRKVLQHDGVDVLIVAGVTPAEDKVPPHGWYVFCNGRMVLEADRTRVTGWGDGLPQWQPKYRRFVGYAYFRSDDVRRLPWMTTKQGVVFESSLYQTALAEMVVQARPVITFLNNLYPGEQLPEGVLERKLLAQVQPVLITEVPKAEGRFKVDLAREKSRQENRLINISYKKPQKDIDRARECIKGPGLSAKKIGEYTFEYFLKQECE